MDYVVDSALFAMAWRDMVFGVTQACVQLLFYGIYLNLFLVAISTLGRRKIPKRGILLLHMWILTVFGTTQVVLCLIETATLVRLVQEYVEHGTTATVLKMAALSKSLQTAQHFVFMTNSLLAHFLFLYRCYVIWGACRCRGMVIILPTLLVFGTFITGCVVATPRFGISPPLGIQRLPFVMAIITNTVLVTLTAGRIYWIRRDAKSVCADNTLVTQYNTIIATILESGAIHAILATAQAITYPQDHVYPAGISFWAIQALSVHFINIAPSLIIVRVGCGHEAIEGTRNIDAKPAKGQY
ncbi:hypothetical protein C8R46DRAFT_1286720 [Mycena filopes]|nr:hypothetical protein C8R46DRAFT_1286720 [Mycena filopes]